ncbi:MAG TPA: lipid A deacylase LpxR family protein [Candidatus Saccharicenans sp.]|nr:lipid A deacylase LpxR family protein [Candidatus Saccharicenans sp.]
MRHGGSYLELVLLVLALGLNLNWPLFAGQPPEFPAGPAGKGNFVFNLENDVWLDRDDGYTNGLSFGWVCPPLDEESKSSWLRFLYRLNTRLLGNDKKIKSQNNYVDPETSSQRWAVLSIAQGIFTPADLTREEIISDDRPYAGLLLASLTFVRNSGRTQTCWGGGLGVVGPFSLAETAQKWLHRTYGWTEPRGWSNQLKNEPVVDIWLSRFWTIFGSDEKETGWRPAFRAGLGGQLGNLMTGLEATLDFRFGLNVQPEKEALLPSPLFNQVPLSGVKRTSVYGFCRLTGRALARNLLIEGNTFVSSHGQSLRHFYGQLISGLAYESQQAAISFYAVIRTKEFKGQKYFDPYCGLSLSLAL